MTVEEFLNATVGESPRLPIVVSAGGEVLYVEGLEIGGRYVELVTGGLVSPDKQPGATTFVKAVGSCVSCGKRGGGLIEFEPMGVTDLYRQPRILRFFACPHCGEMERIPVGEKIGSAGGRRREGSQGE